MASLIEFPFNPKPSTVMHIDLNSCFATAEQQADRFLRGKPVAVAAYTGPSGCIVAPSVEAKRYGVKVGMRVKDGKMLCPDLIVLPPDPWKYRNLHLELRRLLGRYTDLVTPKSIDEFVLDLEGYPAFSKGMHEVGREIKRKIKEDVGEWLTVSIGIGPNRFLAKLAASLRKPDGLDEINLHNYETVYSFLKLRDLCGIKTQNSSRLNYQAIYTVIDFYEASIETLKAAFSSINGYYWYLRLHGWEIDDVDFGRKSYGNSYALPQKYSEEKDLMPIIMKLTTKMSQRLRKAGYHAEGVHLSMLFVDGTHWHMGRKTGKELFATIDIYRELSRVFRHCPYRKPVANVAVSVFDLLDGGNLQLDMFEPTLRKESLYKAIDVVNARWGDYVMTPARMMGTGNNVPDRVAFGGVKELEEFVNAV